MMMMMMLALGAGLGLCLKLLGTCSSSWTILLQTFGLLLQAFGLLLQARGLLSKKKKMEVICGRGIMIIVSSSISHAKAD